MESKDDTKREIQKRIWRWKCPCCVKKDGKHKKQLRRAARRNLKNNLWVNRYVSDGYEKM